MTTAGGPARRVRGGFPPRNLPRRSLALVGSFVLGVLAVQLVGLVAYRAQVNRAMASIRTAGERMKHDAARAAAGVPPPATSDHLWAPIEATATGPPRPLS